MGTLGRYLQEAREALGIDLREASQQTRISLQYLKALEAEDFSRLPGEVFVRGFLKNYGKFLHLDESEVMKKYSESGPKKPAVTAPAGVPVTAAPPAAPQAAEASEPKLRSDKLPVEPFVWGAGIVIVLLVFLFTALPNRHRTEKQQAVQPVPEVISEIVSTAAPTTTPGKLYLEVVALENTWLLIRTDASPQKKALLNRGESLIWSADERFLLSYGAAGALKLLLNGNELIVDEPRNAVIRDLTITAAGIANHKKMQMENARLSTRPTASTQPTTTQRPAPRSDREKPQRKTTPQAATAPAATAVQAPAGAATTASPEPGATSGQTGSAQ